MKKIIFVCTSGTCRSPMAEHLLKHKLKQVGILGNQVQVSSAGLMANENETIEPHTVFALKQLGIVVNAKQKSRQLHKEMVTKDTLIIAISQAHKQWIQNLPCRTIALSDLDGGVDIPDPYGQGLKQYQKVARLFDFMLDEVVQKLQEGIL